MPEKREKRFKLVVNNKSKLSRVGPNEYPVLKLNTTNLYGLKKFWDRFSIGLRVNCSARWWVLFRSKVRNSRCWGIEFAHDDETRALELRCM